MDADRRNQQAAEAGAMHPEAYPLAHSAARHEDELESFAGGEIQVRHGGVNRWLLVVYLILFLWSLYYLFTYWGGLGPGLAY